MALMRGQDRQLFTATESALIESSGPSQITAHTPKQLQDRIVRARRFVDKYRDLARAQQRRTKRSPQQPSSNLRTHRKVQAFARALDRFEQRLARLTQEARRKSRPQGKPVAKRSLPRASQREAIRRMKQQRQAADEAALAPRVARQFQKSKLRAIQGHISARGKRRQAKRDTR